MFLGRGRRNLPGFAAAGRRAVVDPRDWRRSRRRRTARRV